MASHKAKTKMSAKRMASRMRKRGLSATVRKAKKGYSVYTDQKGRR